MFIPFCHCRSCKTNLDVQQSCSLRKLWNHKGCYLHQKILRLQWHFGDQDLSSTSVSPSLPVCCQNTKRLPWYNESSCTPAIVLAPKANSRTYTIMHKNKTSNKLKKRLPYLAFELTACVFHFLLIEHADRINGERTNQLTSMFPHP